MENTHSVMLRAVWDYSVENQASANNDSAKIVKGVCTGTGSTLTVTTGLTTNYFIFIVGWSDSYVVSGSYKADVVYAFGINPSATLSGGIKGFVTSFIVNGAQIPISNVNLNVSSTTFSLQSGTWSPSGGLTKSGVTSGWIAIGY